MTAEKRNRVVSKTEGGRGAYDACRPHRKFRPPMNIFGRHRNFWASIVDGHGLISPFQGPGNGNCGRAALFGRHIGLIFERLCVYVSFGETILPLIWRRLRAGLKVKRLNYHFGGMESKQKKATFQLRTSNLRNLFGDQRIT